LKFCPTEFIEPLQELIATKSTKEDRQIHCVEIGPGSGIVTEGVYKAINEYNKMTSFNFILIEIDNDLIPNLYNISRRYNVQHTIIAKNVIELDLSEQIRQNLTPNKTNYLYLFSSLPYYLAKKIISWQLESFYKLSEIKNLQILPVKYIIQKEVALEFLTDVPNKDFLGNFRELLCKDFKIERNLDPNAFVPAPGVDSSLISYQLLPITYDEYMARLRLLKFIKGFYIYKRKTVGKILKMKKIRLPDISKLLQKRPEEVSVNEWRMLKESVGAME